MRPGRRLGYAVVVGLAAAFIAEGVARLVIRESVYASVPSEAVKSHLAVAGDLVYDPVLGWRRSVLPNPVLGLERHGFRHADVAEAKAPGALRGFVLGDSQTFGAGVDPGEDYPSVAEATLRSRGLDVEVINAGVPSADADLMSAWCLAEGPRFEVDEVLWARRPAGPGGVDRYATLSHDCAAKLHARLTVVLSPISTFDPHGSAVYRQEASEVRTKVGPQVDVIELTDVVRAAQAGRGEVLEHRGGKAAVVDQETGKTWLEAPWSDGDLDPSIYALFEAHPDVREALFLDEGHPDEEGAAIIAKAVADRLRP